MLFKDLDYKYWRKRSREAKSGKYAITMRNLALFYLVCKKRMPHEGVAQQVEEIFSETNKYDDVFPENSISRELTDSSDHIVMQYMLVWKLAEALDALKRYLPKRDREYYNYTSYFVLADLFERVLEWKRREFNLPGRRNWKDFIESPQFENGIWTYVQKAFQVVRTLLPQEEEARKYLRKKEATDQYFKKRPKSGDFNGALSKALGAFHKAQGR